MESETYSDRRDLTWAQMGTKMLRNLAAERAKPYGYAAIRAKFVDTNSVFKYLLFFPPVVTFAAVVPVWMGHSFARFVIVATGFTATHAVLQAGHHRIVKEYRQNDIP